MEIAVRFAGGRKVEATFKGMTITTDQPESRGGEESAPSPFDLFLASIATCSGYYVLDFCLNRDIPIEGVSLVMHTERDTETRMLTKITVEIRLPAHFPEKYDKAVIRACDLCSVKKHIVKPPPVFDTYITRK